MTIKIIKMVVDSITNEINDKNQWSMDIGLETKNNGPWLTVTDTDLPRKPKIGDVLIIKLPEILGYDE